MCRFSPNFQMFWVLPVLFAKKAAAQKVYLKKRFGRIREKFVRCSVAELSL
jgi:hypothetical protein